MNQSVSITRQFQGADINIVIPLEMEEFADLMIKSINVLVSETPKPKKPPAPGPKKRESIRFSLQTPSDLEFIFKRSQEDPEILVLFGLIKRSTKLLFGAIPDNVKAAALAGNPIGNEPVDRAIDNLVQSSPPIYPDPVKVSIAILTVLFYIEQVNQILIDEINAVVDMIQKGTNPVTLVSQIPDVALVDWTGGRFTFTVSKTFDYTRMSASSTYMVDKSQRYVNSLPQEVKESLVKYTKCYYKNINTYLRAGVITPGCSLIDLKANIANIDAAFQNATPISEPMILYRGQEEDIFDTKSYTSASTLINTTSNFYSASSECCIFQITVTPGSKVLPLASISNIPSESEILLDRDGKFFFTGREMKTIMGEIGRHIEMRFYYMTYMPGDSRKLDDTPIVPN